jgi:hypothetical protein
VTFALYAPETTDGGIISHVTTSGLNRCKKVKLMTHIDYEWHEDYLIPCIVLNEPSGEQVELITWYGVMRRRLLREHRAITYSRLLLSERLYPHLSETQKKALKRLDCIMSYILAFNPPPDKATDGIVWASHMTEVHRVAEKMMLDEVVYA